MLRPNINKIGQKIEVVAIQSHKEARIEQYRIILLWLDYNDMGIFVKCFNQFLQKYSCIGPFPLLNFPSTNGWNVTLGSINFFKLCEWCLL